MLKKFFYDDALIQKYVEHYNSPFFLKTSCNTTL